MRTNQKLFEEALERLMANLQAMKSSEDIQEGIYLDIMDRSERKVGLGERRYSRSKISETLHAKYGTTQGQQVRNSKGKADFVMEWETFRELNWKQIMGIVMVKDRRCQKIRGLLRTK